MLTGRTTQAQLRPPAGAPVQALAHTDRPQEAWTTQRVCQFHTVKVLYGMYTDFQHFSIGCMPHTM
eukprot:215097-Pelagomonas_calceolata.AAC.1